MVGAHTCSAFAVLALLALGGCVTSDAPDSAIRPVLSIERSGAPTPTQVAGVTYGTVRIPQMKVIHVPPRTTAKSSAAPVARRPLPAAEGELMLPLEDAVLTSGFGIREHPITGGERVHRGIDLAAPAGTPIYAAAAGIVDEAGLHGGHGNYVRIRHAGGMSTAYGHMSRYAPGIAAGASVQQGQVVGYVGSTGLSTGPHLHWEVLFGGEAVDPMRIIGPELRIALGRGNNVAALPAAAR